MVFKIAINGFGRIGRFVFRAIRHLYPTECQVVAIHDLCDIKTNVHLLKYDSAHHTFQENLNITSEDTFEVGEGNNKWVVKNIGGKLGPSELPWRELQVDAVLESTGLFRKHAVKEGGKVVTDGYDGHLFAGAKRVVLSVPSADEIECTLVLGVNDEDLKPNTTLISNASCTTNCLAPIIKILNDKFGVLSGFMTTVHSYTNDQKVTDVMHKDLRRARAAAMNIIPTSTGAAVALPRVVHGLKNGCMDGLSLRVPSITGSLVDVSINTREKVTKEQVNEVLKNACEIPALKDIMKYSDDPIVSSDIIDDPHSSIVDGLSTMVIQNENGSFVKVLSWYDNEWMYSCCCADIFHRIKKLEEEEIERKRSQYKSFSYQSSNPFNGIINYLTKLTNGNVQLNKTIEITCSNLWCGNYEAVVDYNNESGHAHVHGEPKWLKFDFKNRKLQIDSYLIKSAHTDSNSHCSYYLKNWKIEISLDGNQWTTIDERSNDSELNGNYKMHIFNLSKKSNPFRFIRIFSDQPNW